MMYYGMMAIQLAKRVRLYSCNKHFTLQMAECYPELGENNVINYIINTEVDMLVIYIF
jgi:hypothetical protein